MKWTKELEEQLTKVLKSLDGDIERNPQMRYWGGPIEEYYLLIWAKKNVAMDINCAFDDLEKLNPQDRETCEKYIAEEIMYGKILKILRNKYPHVIKWAKEMLGCGCTHIC